MWIVTTQAMVPGSACMCSDTGASCDTCPDACRCVIAAPGEGGTRDLFYVDADSGGPLWHVSYDFDFVDKVNIEVVGGKLHVSGAGCDLTKARP
jgi:hypothetical protein